MTVQQSPPTAPAGAERGDQSWRVPAICLVLAAITFAVFGQTLHHQFINCDDTVYVYENATVEAGLSLKGIVWVFTHADCDLYHPLTMLSLMADCQFYRLNAGGYHLTNVLLHTGSAILLFLVLRQMTGALWRSAFVAAVFAIHPLRVESVAWVAERKDVLGTFFFMLTLGAYVRYVSKSNSPARYMMVAAAFVLALLSKPTVVTLPFVLLLLDYWPLRRFEQPRMLSRLVLEKIPLLMLSVAACAMTMLAVKQGVAAYANIPMPARLGNALVSYVVYLRQMVWPEGLAVFYPYPPNGFPPWELMLAGTLLAVLSGVAAWQRRKRGWLFVGWFWYLGMLIPMIGIVQAGAFAHADRMTCLPQIGICVAVTWLVAEWQVSREVLGALMAGVLAVLMVSAWRQTTYWQNDETLWSHALACTTGNYFADNNLGLALVQKGRVDEAIAHYKEALEIKPSLSDAHYNLGTALLQKGRVDEGIAQCQIAMHSNPDNVIWPYNLGVTLLQKGRVDEAITFLQQALQITPEDPKIHNNLGYAFRQKGRDDEAISHYQKALQINPSDPRVQNNLAWLLATCPQASLRNGDKALQLARKANEETGGATPTVLCTLAAAFAESGRFSEAVDTAQLAWHLAEVQSNTVMAEQLQTQLKLYQAGSPFHSPAPTH